MKILLRCLLLGACLCAGVRAQVIDPAPAISLGQTVHFTSKLLGETRPLQVYLPPSYQIEAKRYPVLYLLDGDRNFLHVVAALQFLADGGRVPEMIVVSLPNTNRERDLSPPLEAELKPGAPKPGPTAVPHNADLFHRFMADELFPWVESTYRTEPFRLLVGHSRGGLFTFYTLLHRPELFNAYIAVSPAIWWDNNSIVREAKERLAKLPPQKTKRLLYFTAGYEADSIVKNCTEMKAILEEVKPAGLEWHYRYMENEQHMTNHHRTTYDGLETLFSDFQIPREKILAEGLAGVEAQYASLEARYGFKIPPQRGMLDWVGYYLMQQKKPEMAVAVFERNVELYPWSGESFAGLASAYQGVGRTQDAARALQRAYYRATDW